MQSYSIRLLLMKQVLDDTSSQYRLLNRHTLGYFNRVFKCTGNNHFSL